MAKQRRAALVYAGPVSRGSLTHLSGLRSELSFVKSSSIPTASRAVKALDSGRAVRTYEEMECADLILISVPDERIPAIIGELAESRLNWTGRAAVLYDSCSDSSALTPLASRGSYTASLNWCPHPERFIAEGDPQGIRRLRSVVGSPELLVLQSKSSYFEGLQRTTGEFYTLLAEAVESFQNAGMTKAAAEKTAASLFAESARTWLRVGRRLLNDSKRRSSSREQSPAQQDAELV